MVIHGDGQNAFRPVLPDDVIVQPRLDLGGFEQFYVRPRFRPRAGVQNLLAAAFHALVADTNAVRPDDQLPHLFLGSAAERTITFLFFH